MGIKNDYKKAVELAKQGKYEQARNLIITYDDPRTDKLLAKLNTAIQSKPTAAQTEQDKQKQQVTGCLLLIVIAICGVVWFSVSTYSNSTDGRLRSFATTVCARVTFVYETDCSIGWLAEYNVDALNACIPDGDFSRTDEAVDLYIMCLDREGVPILD